MSRRCGNCGTSVSDTDIVCPNCGTQVERGPGLNNNLASGKLVPCSDCGREISRKAPMCPHCGAPRAGLAQYSRYTKPDWGFEWRTQAEIMGYPLVHVAVGRKNGKLRVAKGVIAIGQFAIGMFTLAQFGVGFIFGFGQFICGVSAIAQFAITIAFGLGQFATGYVAIGQFALGFYALGQMALGWHVWRAGFQDPEAVRFFIELARAVGLKK